MAVKYRRARRTAWRAIAGETILLDLEHKRMAGLNPAAAALWLALESPASLDELSATTAGDGGTAIDKRHISVFLEELVGLGLAEEQPPGPEACDPRRAEVARVTSPDPGPADELDPPRVLWQEDVEQIAGTCAMFPSQNPICNQAPFS